ncbi:hypothetical protein BSR28_06490 [Boudabousia liubingyangii]|uniref:hypothetical protein n=1 Tax=Boudabousia liubingyangii TaxID=1921764 RepID=UPI0009397074|nr:hypothetical protein [Boudabousia liubingyangii]OKL47054.1 hypothetical protein BSR28_06490 [Boudabousia liubingyangii]
MPEETPRLSFGAIFAGRLFTGLVEGFLIWVCVLLVAWFLRLDVGVGLWAQVVFGTAFVAAAVLAWFQYVLAGYRNVYVPSGWGFVFGNLLLHTLTAFGVAVALLQSFLLALVPTVCVLVFSLGFALWLQEWKPGPTPEEVAERKAALHKLTEETKAEIREEREQQRRQRQQRDEDDRYDDDGFLKGIRRD